MFPPVNDGVNTAFDITSISNDELSTILGLDMSSLKNTAYFGEVGLQISGTSGLERRKLTLISVISVMRIAGKHYQKKMKRCVKGVDIKKTY